ncbi:MAG: DUF1002 domain-containing protein [Christensenellaceae bacterium]|nr:DUF1002 domain-containing protein [Christensenellaceae bacterium]
MLRKTLALFLSLVMIFGMFGATPVFAEHEGEKRAVIAKDLDEDEIEQIYEDFGVERGSVKEITVTNQDERAYLEGLVEDEKIGNVALSCVYIEMLEEGSGLELEINNIKWCTEAIYKNAFLTAGITDAKVIISAPHPVTGTAALTGIYLAYEDITGKSLDELAKELAVEELITTGELAEIIGSEQAVEIINSLKEILDEVAEMTDDEVRTEIRYIADELNVSLTDAQVDQILELVRDLQGLNVEELQDRLEGYAKALEGVQSVGTFFENIGKKVTSFFQTIGNFFSNLFGGNKNN